MKENWVSPQEKRKGFFHFFFLEQVQLEKISYSRLWGFDFLQDLSVGDR